MRRFVFNVSLGIIRTVTFVHLAMRIVWLAMPLRLIAPNAPEAGVLICPQPIHVHCARLVAWLATILTSVLSVRTLCTKKLMVPAPLVYTPV